MANLALTHENLTAALARLHEALTYLEKAKNIAPKQITIFEDSTILQAFLRDSVIQRFEFCTDLFWKYVKRYLEEKLGITLEAYGPKSIITAACRAKIITEVDGEQLLRMIKSRNLTSHIYKEKVAQQISDAVPDYYRLMKKYSQKLAS